MLGFTAGADRVSADLEGVVKHRERSHSSNETVLSPHLNLRPTSVTRGSGAILANQRLQLSE